MTQSGAGIAVCLALYVELLPGARPRHDSIRNLIYFSSKTFIFSHNCKIFFSQG